MNGHDNIMIDIITFFLIVLIFFTHVSNVTFGAIRNAGCIVTHMIMTASDAEDAA